MAAHPQQWQRDIQARLDRLNTQFDRAERFLEKRRAHYRKPWARVTAQADAAALRRILDIPEAA